MLYAAAGLFVLAIVGMAVIIEKLVFRPVQLRRKRHRAGASSWPNDIDELSGANDSSRHGCQPDHTGGSCEGSGDGGG